MPGLGEKSDNYSISNEKQEARTNQEDGIEKSQNEEGREIIIRDKREKIAKDKRFKWLSL